MNRFGVLFLVIFLVLLSCAMASAADVNLAWDQNSEENLAGYKVYFLSGNGNSELTEGTSPITVNIADLENPASPGIILHGLSEGNRYFFSLTAFNDSGIESAYSNYVSYVSMPDAPDVPAKVEGLKITGTINLTVESQ